MASFGTFSGGGLGFGVAFGLENTSQNAFREIDRDLKKLDLLTDTVSKSMSRSMERVKLGFGTAAIGALLIAPFAMGVKNASDLEESINKVTVAFGEYVNQSIEFSDTSLDIFGIDKNSALDMLALFGDMATGMGISQKVAVEMSKTMTGLAGDLASFKNIDVSQASNAIKGVFTGETEPLKNLGIIMTITNLKAYALSTGMNKLWKDMSQAEKVQLRYNFILEKSQNSIGDFQRTAEGFANTNRVFAGGLKEISTTLGNILMPMLTKVMTAFVVMFKAINRFAQSPIGKFILSIVLALGLLLLVMGLAVGVTAALRFGIMSLAGAFGASTKAAILNTIVTKGLTAGLRQMAVAAWASLGPLLLIIGAVAAVTLMLKKLWDMIRNGNKVMIALGSAVLFLLGPIGWIIAGFVLLKRAVEEFNNVGSRGFTSTGIIGFLQRVGAHVVSAIEIWRSWNGETFTLTDTLHKKLEAMGLLDSVLALGTWIVRVKEFFRGIWTGLVEGFTIVKDVFISMYEWFVSMYSPMNALEESLDKIGLGIRKNTTDIEKWKKAGKIIGLVLVGIFVTITIAALLMSIAIIAYFVGILAILALAVAIIWLVYKAIMFLWEGMKWVAEMIVAAWNWVADTVMGFFTWMSELPARMFGVGTDFVTNLWEGIKSVWGDMLNWLDNAMDEVVSFFDVFGMFDDSSVDINTTGAGTIAVQHQNIQAINEAGRNRGALTNNEALGFSKTQRSILPRAIQDRRETEQQQPIIIQTYVDGEMIREQLANASEVNDARN